MAIRSVELIKGNAHGRIDAEAKIQGVGECYVCKSLMMVLLGVEPLGEKFQLPEVLGAIWAQAQRLEEGLKVGGNRIWVVQTFPDLSIYQVPKGIPDDVAEVFADGDANIIDRRFRTALSCYATALEFACDRLLEGAHSEKPLGGKLKQLSGKNTLPPALLDFMEVIKIDRKTAVHYRTPVTEEAAEAVRTLTQTTLEYLYSLPSTIDAARKRLEKATAKSESMEEK